MGMPLGKVTMLFRQVGKPPEPKSLAVTEMTCRDTTEPLVDDFPKSEREEAVKLLQQIKEEK